MNYVSPAAQAVHLRVDRQPLARPEIFLPFLARNVTDSVVFFSRAIDGEFLFVSEACEAALGRTSQTLIGGTLEPYLTASDCNEEYRRKHDDRYESANAIKSRCEIYLQTGETLSLEEWQIPFIQSGVCYGTTGILYKEPAKVHHVSTDAAAVRSRVDSLSAVERQVVEMVVDGNMNKEIAYKLGVALRTIESRRARAMSKLKLNSLPSLVQLWVQVRELEEKA